MAGKKKKKVPDYFWNHRVVKRSVTRHGIKEVWFEVVEAHYDKKKSTTMPFGITDAIPLVGDTKKELADTLRRIQRALKKPVLSETKFPATPKR